MGLKIIPNIIGYRQNVILGATLCYSPTSIHCHINIYIVVQTIFTVMDTLCIGV